MEVDGTVGVLVGFGAVGYDDDGVAGFVVVGEASEDNAGVVWVEVAGGLICEHDMGLVEHGAGDGCALLFAGAELCGVVAAAWGQAQFVHKFGCAGLRFGDAAAAGRRIFSATVRYGTRWNIWKTNPMFRALKRVALGGGHTVEITIFEEDSAASCAACQPAP